MNNNQRRFIQFEGEVIDLYSIYNISKIDICENTGEASFFTKHYDGGEIIFYFNKFALLEQNIDAATKSWRKLFKMLDELMSNDNMEKS